MDYYPCPDPPDPADPDPREEICYLYSRAEAEDLTADDVSNVLCSDYLERGHVRALLDNPVLPLVLLEQPELVQHLDEVRSWAGEMP